jgi:pimeloyl-ACP methyl ester carboxylesterase
LLSDAEENEFPVGLMPRPSQLNAASTDAMHMIPDAIAMSQRYSELRCAVATLAGDADKIVSMEAQASRLHATIPGSTLDVFAGDGHMIHHADPLRVLQAINSVAHGRA